MKAVAVSVVASLLAFATVASENAVLAKKPAKDRTPEEWYQILMQKEYKRTGGKIRKDGSAKGLVVVVNAQKRVDAAVLRRAIDVIDAQVHAPVALKEASGVKLSNPKKDVAALGGNLGVVVADSPDLAKLTLAPEDGWAVVNVAALAEDGAKDEVLASRVRKEILRGFGLIAGCSYMGRGQIVLAKGLTKPSHLDQIKAEAYGSEDLVAMERELPAYGILPWREATYLQACEEGWAPLPTNDVQKAIWNKVHNPPNKPMKITYDKDRQKPVVK